MNAPNVVDFETHPIESRPAYPPRPVGVFLRPVGEKKRRYFAWGHPTENNCDEATGKRVVRDAWKEAQREGNSLAFHHSKFDTDVAEEWAGVKPLSWEHVHDTLYLLFLHDPHAQDLSLKPASEKILGLPSEERDLLKEWIMAHIPEAKRKPTEWGRYICKAPGNIVGRYAGGDVTRTDRLFTKLLPEIRERGMEAAYNRERRLMPVLLQSEREGIRVNLGNPVAEKDYSKSHAVGIRGTLEHDYAVYRVALDKADEWLRKKLKAPNLNLDADKDVGDALDAAGQITEWVYTAPTKTHPTGQRSVAKKNMTLGMFKDRQLAMVYGYRVRLKTCLSMFFEPWLRMGRASGGIIFTNWNQVRQANSKGNFAGARTGRLSSNPNFMNIPKDFEDKDDGFKFLSFMLKLGLLPLPLMRRYLLPDKGELWGHRDINQQELRLLAHFEDGSLAQRYNEKPWYVYNEKKDFWELRFDIHTTVQTDLRVQFELELTRTGTKITNFSEVYGRGLGAMAVALGVDVATVKRIKGGMRELMPDVYGVDGLVDCVKRRGKDGLPIRTWGGREYYCEKPGFSKKHKREMSFEYKLLNYLIQGSAADVTKEALIRYAEHPKRQSRFLVTVHDEINSSMPKERLEEEMSILRESIEGIETDVVMLSDGKVGESWGDLSKYREVRNC